MASSSSSNSHILNMVSKSWLRFVPPTLLRRNLSPLFYFIFHPPSFLMTYSILCHLWRISKMEKKFNPLPPLLAFNVNNKNKINVAKFQSFAPMSPPHGKPPLFYVIFDPPSFLLSYSIISHLWKKSKMEKKFTPLSSLLPSTIKNNNKIKLQSFATSFQPYVHQGKPPLFHVIFDSPSFLISYFIIYHLWKLSKMEKKFKPLLPLLSSTKSAFLFLGTNKEIEEEFTKNPIIGLCSSLSSTDLVLKEAFSKLETTFQESTNLVETSCHDDFNKPMVLQITAGIKSSATKIVHTKFILVAKVLLSISRTPFSILHSHLRSHLQKLAKQKLLDVDLLVYQYITALHMSTQIFIFKRNALWLYDSPIT